MDWQKVVNVMVHLGQELGPVQLSPRLIFPPDEARERAADLAVRLVLRELKWPPTIAADVRSILYLRCCFAAEYAENQLAHREPDVPDEKLVDTLEQLLTMAWRLIGPQWYRAALQREIFADQGDPDPSAKE
jgi:hypothetical protein